MSASQDVPERGQSMIIDATHRLSRRLTLNMQISHCVSHICGISSRKTQRNAHVHMHAACACVHTASIQLRRKPYLNNPGSHLRRERMKRETWLKEQVNIMTPMAHRVSD